MKNLTLLFFLIIAFSLALTSNTYGQPASATWPLSSTTTVTVTVSGEVTGQDESFGNMAIYNYSGPNSSQRVIIAGGTWPAETNQDDNRYIQFAVSPNTGYDFNISSVALSLGASGGSNMKANIWYSTDPTFTVRTQLNTSVLSLPKDALSSLSYTPSVTVNSGSLFYLRIYPWYTTGGTGKYVCPQDVVISGNTTGNSSFITTSVSSLSSFQHTLGTPSSTQSYTVSGTTLTDDITITPPVGFEISDNGGSSWNNNSLPLVLTQSGGIIPGQPITISVRMNGSSAAPYSGNIVHSSTGATTQNVAVNGVTLAAEPTTQSSISFGTVTGNSIVVNFSGGNGSNRVIVAHLGSAVSWAPTDGNAVSGVNSNFATATDQGSGNKAVYDGTGTSVTVTGLQSNTTYHFAVYEYNVGSGNSQNYNTTSPGTGNQTTLDVPMIAVAPASLVFGAVEINTTSIEKTYSLSANSLTPTSGNITVTAPTGYEVSITSGSGFSSSIDVPYTGGTLAATTIYVVFEPTSLSTYNGNITNAGGGATTENVSVTGNGIEAGQQNVLEAEEGILDGAYVMSQYAGYSGTGYVDIGNRDGAALDITFRRATAATDTVRIYYALGGSTRSYDLYLNGASLGSLSFPSTGSWTSWSSVTTTISLVAGVNRLRFEATTNTSDNANIDRIYIGGQAATPIYKLILAKSGNGTVTAVPDSLSSYYDAGTSVTIAATPAGGSMFYRWSGTDQSTSNPYVITMNSHKTEIAIMPVSPGFGSFPYDASPKGFASVGALTYPSGTTGGSGTGSQATYVTNSTDLLNLMYYRIDPNHVLNFPPLIIYVIGTLTADPGVAPMLDVKDVYDISIIGVGVDATISGFGLSIVRAKNIVVRNIKFMNSPDDGIAIQADDVEGTGNHIWIDHCDFTNCYDGALDVTHTASYITLSWNHFYKHDKTCLQGHSDSQTSDVAMKTTWHHNFFDSTGQRHPRVRYGKAHVYNNYYYKNSLYGVSSNCEADVVVEGSYFLDVPTPVESLRVGTSYPGDLVERNNIFAGTTGTGSTRGTAFDPSLYYSFSVDDPAAIPAMLTSYSGSGKYDFSSSEPPVQYQIVSSAGANGSIMPSGTTYVNSGESQSYTITPATGYLVDSVIVDDVYYGAVTSYNFTNVTANHTIRATFALLQTSSVIINTAWNIVSVPRVQTNDTATAIFPDLYGAMYEFVQGIGYAPVTTLTLGKGYWLYYQNPDTVVISGDAPGSTVINATAGWNIIGSRETPIDVSSLVLSGGTTISGGVVYAFVPGSGYLPQAVINPGQGVWAYVSADCTITFP